MKLIETIASLVEPTITDMGYELYDIDFLKEYGAWELLITIDSPNGVTLDDCEAVSRAVEPILDEADPIEQAYNLTISSVGIARPLKIEKDFVRNIGNTVDIKLYAAMTEGALHGKKALTGVLTSFDEDSFTVDINGESYTFPKKAAALLRPHIDF